MKYLKRFLEHFSIEGDDNSVKNVADDVFNKIQDIFSIPFRVLIKKRPYKSMCVNGWSYLLLVLFKNDDSKYVSETEKFIRDSRKRFKIRLDFKIVTSNVDRYIYSKSYTNGVLKNVTYDNNIIYDEKSDFYLDDINESYIEDEILKFVYDLDKIKTQLDIMSYDGSWYDLSYKWDDLKNRIIIEFGFSGYSEGFSQIMTIEKLRSLGQIKVNITEPPEEDSGSIEFDSFDDIIQYIKDNFGL